MQYRDLYALFRREPEAKRYFDALPTHVMRPLGKNRFAASLSPIDGIEDSVDAILSTAQPLKTE